VVRGFRERHREDAVGVAGAGFLLLDVLGQREGAADRPAAALASEVVAVARLGGFLALGGDPEGAVGHREVDVLAVVARQIGSDLEGVLAIGEVDRELLGSGSRRLVELAELLVHPLEHSFDLLEGVAS